MKLASIISIIAMLLLSMSVATAFQITETDITSYSCSTEGECELSSSCGGLFTGVGSTDFDGVPPYPYCTQCSNAHGYIFADVPFPPNVTEIESGATLDVDFTDYFPSGWGSAYSQWWDGSDYFGGTTCTGSCLTWANANQEFRFKFTATFENFGTIEDSVNNYQVTSVTIIATESCTPDWNCTTWECIEPNANETCTAVSDNNACGDAYTGDYTEFGVGAECVWCVENWTQNEPSSCDGLISNYTITYTDQNACGTTDDLPIDNGTVEPCCIEDWTQILGPCVSSHQLISYDDDAACGTAYQTPVDNGTTQTCGTSSSSQGNTRYTVPTEAPLATESPFLSVGEGYSFDVKTWLTNLWANIKEAFIK